MTSQRRENGTAQTVIQNTMTKIIRNASLQLYKNQRQFFVYSIKFSCGLNTFWTVFHQTSAKSVLRQYIPCFKGFFQLQPDGKRSYVGTIHFGARNPKFPQLPAGWEGAGRAPDPVQDSSGNRMAVGPALFRGMAYEGEPGGKKYFVPAVLQQLPEHLQNTLGFKNRVNLTKTCFQAAFELCNVQTTNSSRTKLSKCRWLRLCAIIRGFCGVFLVLEPNHVLITWIKSSGVDT